MTPPSPLPEPVGELERWDKIVITKLGRKRGRKSHIVSCMSSNVLTNYMTHDPFRLQTIFESVKSDSSVWKALDKSIKREAQWNQTLKIHLVARKDLNWQMINDSKIVAMQDNFETGRSLFRLEGSLPLWRGSTNLGDSTRDKRQTLQSGEQKDTAGKD
jgi:hypothetical protein